MTTFSTRAAGATAATVLLSTAAVVAVGDYVYRTGTAVSCGVRESQVKNSLSRYHTPGQGRGPFRGPGWNRWVEHDLSSWWATDVQIEEVQIEDPDRPVQIAAWWITPSYPTRIGSVIVAHGINSSRRDFSVLLSGAMLVRQGLNVLLIDLRDQGDTTCEDARHSAGQDESDDIITAANWLQRTKAIPTDKIGVHGISGGAIAAIIAAAKSPAIAAFSLDSPIFDFNTAATHEVEFQGFPGFLWRAAYWAARLRGVDLMGVSPADGVTAAGHRPVQVFHGTNDSRVRYRNALDLIAHAKRTGTKATLHTFEGADHIEGMLIDPDRYYRELEIFFAAAFGN